MIGRRVLLALAIAAGCLLLVLGGVAFVRWDLAWLWDIPAWSDLGRFVLLLAVFACGVCGAAFAWGDELANPFNPPWPRPRPPIPGPAPGQWMVRDDE